MSDFRDFSDFSDTPVEIDLEDLDDFSDKQSTSEEDKHCCDECGSMCLESLSMIGLLCFGF